MSFELESQHQPPQNKMMNAVNQLKSRLPHKNKKSSPALLSRESTGTVSGDFSSKEPVQVEPKTYFANERTFIQWISASLLLLTVSSIMMGSGSYNGTSSVIAFASLVLVCYAAYVYFRRVRLLRAGEAYGYLDFIGPTVLAVGVGIGVAIVFADAVKGSEFMPWGDGEGKKNKDDDRRVLRPAQHLRPSWPEVPPVAQHAPEALVEREGLCMRHSLQGLNLLEYQPRDIVLDPNNQDLIVATPQALISHHQLDDDAPRMLLSEIPNVEIQSTTMVGDRLFALSTGPARTELLEFHQDELVSRHVILQESSSTTTTTNPAGSIMFSDGKLYLYLDGTMHTYRVAQEGTATSSLVRIGSLNMKVLNHGSDEPSSREEDPIVAMDHLEGVTYLLRPTMLEAWDFSQATLLDQVELPRMHHSENNDNWVGLALERRVESSSVWLHMPLDTFPPQLWSFRMTENESSFDESNGHSVFRFPDCVGGVEMN